MILVTLGTQDKSFERLLIAIDKEIDKGNIKDKVLVQAGFTYKTYKSKNMEMFDYVDTKTMNDLVKQSDIIISHAGAGSILTALENNKKIIVVPRQSKYGEHNNDHQIEIAEKFSNDRHVLYLKNLKLLGNAIEDIKKFKPAKLNHNEELLNSIEDFIDNIGVKKEKKKKVIFVSSMGGHLTQLLQLKSIFNDYNYILITEKSNVTESLKSEYNIRYYIYCNKKNYLKYFIINVLNAFHSVYTFFKEWPAVIVTTGANTAVPLCYLGRIFGKKVIFIESFAKRNGKTLAGALCYPIATTFIVQWESMLKYYPKAKYFGGIY